MKTYISVVLIIAYAAKHPINDRLVTVFLLELTLFLCAFKKMNE